MKDVLQQALAALKSVVNKDIYSGDNNADYRNLENTITAIEQALSRVDEPVAKEVELNIIRYWPDGFAGRMEHVWKDLIGFIPNYKLYDLQRMLAEYGFTMKVYEGTNLPPQQVMQEPVAWMVYLPSIQTQDVFYDQDDPGYVDWLTNYDDAVVTPLFSAPKHRAPLTDDEIWKSDEIMAANSGYGANFETLRALARAIEAAHGIKGEL